MAQNLTADQTAALLELGLRQVRSRAWLKARATANRHIVRLIRSADSPREINVQQVLSSADVVGEMVERTELSKWGL